MATVLGLDTGINTPSLGGLTSSFGTLVNWIIFIVILLAVLGTATYFIYRWKVYYLKGYFFERINGLRPTLLNTKPIGLRVIKVGMNEGEFLWHKKFGYLPADGYKMGTNTFFFEKNPYTGYWQPFYLRELDPQLAAVDIEYISTDFKGSAYVTRKATEARHQSKKANLDKLLAYGLIGIVVIATLIWSYYTYKQNKDFDAQSEANTLKRLEIESKISEDNKIIITKMEQLLANSGLRTVPG